MNDTEIYLLAYKDNAPELDDEFKVIQCGAAVSNIDTPYIKDNTGDNISEKNEYFVETTGIYWIWKNTHLKYVGNMQYRRHLSVNPRYVSKILEEEYDIIMAHPLIFENITVEEHYAIYHNLGDLALAKILIDRKYPEYSESYVKYIKNGHTLYYSNSFITDRETYDKICSFIFPILFDIEKILNLDDKETRMEHAKKSFEHFSANKTVSHPGEDPNAYQSRVCGYLFERLLTLYVFHNKLTVYHCGDYVKMEKDMGI